MTSSILLAGVTALFLTTSCFRTAVDGHTPRTSEYEHWSATFWWGLAGDAEFDVRRYCGSGAARVKVGGDAFASGLTLLTLGIYVPRVVVVTCAASPGQKQDYNAREAVEAISQ